MTNDLVQIIQPFALEEAQSRPIIDSFGDLFVQAHKLSVLAKGIKVTDESQVEEMQKARDLRRQLQAVRVEASKIKTTLKEGYLRGANGIQAIFNDIKNTTEPMEEYLEQQEKFAEIKAMQRLEVKNSERITELSKYVDDVSVYPVREMSDAAFEKLLADSKALFDMKKAAEVKAEEERLAKEKADREEQAKIKAENERLKKEAEEREKVLAKERAEQQKKLDEERRAKEAAEAKLKAEKEAQLQKERQAKAEADAREKAEADQKAKAKAEEEEQLRQKLLAPDKEKLYDLAILIDSLELPAVSSNDANSVVKAAKEMLSRVSSYVLEGAKKL